MILKKKEFTQYNVLIIGTRKDKDAVKNWNGIEILKKQKNKK